jgi:hypothetical protein
MGCVSHGYPLEIYTPLRRVVLNNSDITVNYGN